VDNAIRLMDMGFFSSVFRVVFIIAGLMKW